MEGRTLHEVWLDELNLLRARHDIERARLAYQGNRHGLHDGHILGADITPPCKPLQDFGGGLLPEASLNGLLHAEPHAVGDLVDEAPGLDFKSSAWRQWIRAPSDALD
jgi:hypothetical protein